MKKVKLERVYFSTIHNLDPDYERFMFVDELELFSRYAGYDLTH